MRRRHVFKLATRGEPSIVIDRSFTTRQEAAEYAEALFLLHPDEDWHETFSIVAVDKEAIVDPGVVSAGQHQ
jgi:hypothetical protein